MIPLYDKGLKKMTSPIYLAFFRSLTYDKKLTYGARLFGLACLDHPGEGKIKMAVVARRMHCKPEQLTRWKKELLKRMYTFTVPIRAET